MKNNFIKLSEEFFFNGYLIGRINNEEIIKKFNLISEKFFDNKIENNNYYFENKNENQFDLKPNTWTYDNIFFDLLIETGLIKILDTITNQNLILTDVRTRIIKKDKKFKPWGYIAPHRIKNGSLSDRLMSFIDSYKSIYKSKNKFCFFPGTLRHWPLKEKSKNGSLRIIYVFRDSRYYEEYKDNELTNSFIKKKEANLLNNTDITFDEEDLKY